MKKFLIAGMAIAMLAVPAAANANVSVDSQGAGFVGKGDVQDALGLANDAAMQSLFNSTTPKGAAIKFTTAEYTATTDNTRLCMRFGGPTGFEPVPGAEPVHVIFTQSVTQAVKATANTNSAGKLTNGWNLTGFGQVTYGPQTEVTIGTCPAGSIGATKTINQEYTESPRSGLMVNGFDLPNTPVQVAPVA